MPTAITAFPGLDGSNSGPPARQPAAASSAALPVPAAAAARRQPDLRWYAAHEVDCVDAVGLIRNALGLPASDLPALLLPLDDGRRWKAAPTGLRAQWLGEWIRAEFFAVADECERPVSGADPLHTVGTRD